MNSFYNGGASTDETTVAEVNAAAQCCAGGYVAMRPDDAIVIDRCTGVDQDVVSEHGIALNDRTSHHLEPVTHKVIRHNGRWVDDLDEVSALILFPQAPPGFYIADANHQLNPVQVIVLLRDVLVFSNIPYVRVPAFNGVGADPGVTAPPQYMNCHFSFSFSCDASSLQAPGEANGGAAVPLLVATPPACLVTEVTSPIQHCLLSFSTASCDAATSPGSGRCRHQEAPSAPSLWRHEVLRSWPQAPSRH